MGLDSLMAAEFRAAIRSERDADIPFGRLLEGATLNDVVRTLAERLGRPDTAAPAVPAPVPRPEAQTLDTVSAEASFGAEMESGEL